MEELLKQLQRGDIPFGVFYGQTDREWRAMATTQYNRMGWRLQGNADVEDVFQEMVMSIGQSVSDYDEERSGMGLKRFVVWRAYAAAKDFINQQCGAYKGRTAGPPRCPVSVSCLKVTGATDDPRLAADTLLEQLSAVGASQEWNIDVQTVRDHVVRTMVDRVVMTSLLEVGGSLRAITDSIYQDERLCVELSLDTPEKTYGMVRRAAKRFVERAACMA